MVTTIWIPAPDGSAEALLGTPPDAEDGDVGLPGVLLYMDAIGLRPQIAEMVDRIASWGYVVLAPNVFYRDGTAEELAPTDDLHEPSHREAFMATAMPRVAAYAVDQATRDADAWVGALQERAGGPMGVVGFCMGARLALRTAARRPDLVVACAGFHAGGLVTDRPDSPHLLVGDVRAELVFGHADQDRSMPAEAVATLGEALDAAGLTAVNEVYAGAAHGYSMRDTSAYDAAATDRAFAALRDLLARTLPSHAHSAA